MSRPDRFAVLALRAAELAGMRLPRRAGLWAADKYQRFLFNRSRVERDAVAANLSRVLGHHPGSDLVQSATRECYSLYGRYWYDTFALRTMPWDEVNSRFSMEGREHIDRALEAGRGIVLALPHMGNWDAAGHWLCLQGYRMTAVAEQLKPREVSDLFLRHRRALGMGIVPLSDGPEVGERLIRLLSENRIVTLVADRSISGRGVEVEMFGAARKIPAGPAMLSLKTGAALSVAAVFTTEEGWHCRIEAPLAMERTGRVRTDVATMTRAIAAGFERSIASAPADWHMLQPAWEQDVAAPPEPASGGPVSA